MPKITCPCCYGTCWIISHDDRGNIIQHDPCGHCEGTGEIEAEVEENGDIIQHGREGP